MPIAGGSRLIPDRARLPQPRRMRAGGIGPPDTAARRVGAPWRDAAPDDQALHDPVY